MKTFGTIMKIVVALAAVAGAIYVAATYGDKIVAWAKNLLERCGCCCNNTCCKASDEAPAEDVEAPAEEAAPVEDGAVHAEEADFEG